MKVETVLFYLSDCRVILILRVSIFYWDKFLETQDLSTER